MAGKRKRQTEQSVLIGVFNVLVLGDVCWGAAKFYGTHLWDVELLLCLALIVVSPGAAEGSHGFCGCWNESGRQRLCTRMFVTRFGKGKMFHADPASKSISLQNLEYLLDKAVTAAFHRSLHSCPYTSQWAGEDASLADLISLPGKRSFE